MSAMVVTVALFVASWLSLRPRARPLVVRLRLGAPRRAPGSTPTARLGWGRRGKPRSRRTDYAGGPAGGSAGDVAVAADLLAVAVAAGCPVRQALTEVASAGASQVASGPLGVAADRLHRGAELADVLDRVAEEGRGWHSLATQLSLSADSGAPAADALRRLASQERLHLRRERERAARRLPVLLLLPLTTMVLPAFLLVTVVPFVVASGASLELPPSVSVPPEPQGAVDED